MPLTRIAYATDVEGNWDYWLRYIELSKVVSRGAEGRLKLEPGCSFVYGGDVCDRGPGDLRVLNDLNNLYDDFPGRVHFILGNRDVNKMRIPVELHPSYLERPGEVYWIPSKSAARETPAERLQWMLKATMGAPGAFEYRRHELSALGKSSRDEDVVNSYIEQVADENSPMLKFLLRGVVAARFADVLFCHGGLNEVNFGWLPPRATNASNTSEATAGAAAASAYASGAEAKTADISLKPGSSGGDICEDFEDWIAECNRRAREEVLDFRTRIASFLASLDGGDFTPHWGSVGSYDHEQPGSRLGYLGMAMIAGPDRKVNPSIIYSSFMSEGMPVDIHPSVTERLKTAGVRRVVVGHQPHGDAPTVIHQNGVQVFMGDTSYAANTLWDHTGSNVWEKRTHADVAHPELGATNLPIASDNTRGISCSEILVHLKDDDEEKEEEKEKEGQARMGPSRSGVHIHGILSDCSTYSFEANDPSTDEYIGKYNLSKTWFVKARNVQAKCGPLKGRSDVYLLSRGEGFNFKNRFVAPEDMADAMSR
jgi:hypothetical protein